MLLKSRLLLVLVLLLVALVGLFLFTYLFLSKYYVVEFETSSRIIPLSSETSISVVLSNATSSSIIVSTSSPGISVGNPLTVPPHVNLDIEPQQPLLNPPAIVKAIYATSWSAGSPKKMSYLIDLINTTELNAIVIDIKDFSGYVAYATDLDLVKRYNALEYRIPKINSLIKRLHDAGIYVIARISIFQDPRLALARPDLALMSSSTGAVWKDKLGLPWIDPGARAAWDYNIAIAREAFERGFDELNFDYIRFPSDGNLVDIKYPFWNQKIPRQEVMREFFKYLREQLSGTVISADLFGLTTVNTDDLGIGQHLEHALTYFDYIAPMVYPSHYHPGFIGYQNPAKYPYEVIKYSMDQAVKRLIAYREAQSVSTTTISDLRFAPSAKLRPWLQDFDLGANYDAQMVRREIQAVYDAFCRPALSSQIQTTTTTQITGETTSHQGEKGRDAQICDPSRELGDKFGGWMLWSPSNIYTRDALLVENNP